MSKATKRWLGIAAALALAIALCIAGFVMASTPAEEPVCYDHGDINGDGVVNKDDAIYLLYASFPGFAEEFPMQQDGKINDDDVVNKDDAIYLLYATTDGMTGYELKGEVHTYFDPTWTWDESAGTATVTLKCACGKSKDGTAAYTTTVDKDPTCVAAGAATLSVEVTVEGTKYTATQTKTIPATEQHTLTVSCTADAKCANCDYEVKASGHKWEKVESATVAATCTAAGQELYKCENCQETDTVVLEQLDHSLSYVENADKATGNPCEFVKQYRCGTCHGVFDGTAAEDTYKKHTYVTTLTQEVTCNQEGKKTTVCSVCNDDMGGQNVETLPKDTTKHMWNDGDPFGSTIVFACTLGCGATKTEVVAAQDGAVNTSDLNENTGVNLGDKTSMAMDKAALDALGDQSIKISVEKMTSEEIENLSQEKKEQIGNNTVYDFTMTDGNNNPITQFSGDVTISLPYTLDEGEDINSIDVWYIDDNGQAVRVDGTYSNGFVTFVTRHFSYYTVTRLTPAERCERLGSHMEVHQTKAATCTEDGFDMTVCQRCGEVISKTPVPKLGHDYSTVTQAATCTDDGQITETCQRSGCNYSVVRKLPAKGHTMVQDTDKSKDPTCTAAGVNVQFCSSGCGYVTEKPLPQKTHNYVVSAEKSVKETCSAGGYELHECSLCGDEIRKNEKAPLGHNYVVEKAQWTWNEDMTASVKLVCDNDETHTKTIDAVVTMNSDKSQNASCLGTGAAVYEAVVSYNKQSYTDTKEITVAAPGHQPGTAWETTDSQHYHLCTVCGEKVDLQGHSWNQGVVSKEPTCVDAGIRTVDCTVCGLSAEQSISATGEHTYVDGKCSTCGFQESACSHEIVRKTQVDSVAAGICSGNVIYKFSCDCGEKAYYSVSKQVCEFGETTRTSTEDEYGYTSSVTSASCIHCGMTITDESYTEVNREACYSEYVYKRTMSKDGVVIAFMEGSYNRRLHPTRIETQTVDLADKGICGGKLITKTCPCGKVTSTVEQLDCDLSYVFDKDTMEYFDVCYTCGVKLYYDTAEKVEGCIYFGEDIITMKKGEETIATYSSYYSHDNHSYEVESYKALGDSCSDGITVVLRCKTCGDTQKTFTTAHNQYNVTVTDLSSSAYCLKEVEVSTCLCQEAYGDCSITYKESGSCEYHEVMDKQTGELYRVCIKCGLRLYTTQTFGEKDADCQSLATYTYTYKSPEGALIVTAASRYTTPNHSMRDEVKLSEGAKTCDQGVEVRQYCVDCGYEYINTFNWHYTYKLNTYDLSEFGSCQTTLTHTTCACGQQSYLEYTGAPCDWRRYSEDETGYTDKCVNCGMLHSVSYTPVESDDPCYVKQLRLDSYTKEGASKTVTISRTTQYESHMVLMELELLPGATNCDGGYTVKWTCERCGLEEDYGVNYEHGRYILGRTRVDNDMMCGVVYQTQIGCACGQIKDTDIEWIGSDNCVFGEGSMNEQLNAWVYTCQGCGSFYSTETKSAPVEGTTCQYVNSQVTHYHDKNGNALFDYSYDNYYFRHDNVTSFTMEGQTCADGYYVSRVCRLCGNTEQDPARYTECNSWNLGSETVYEGTDICGKVLVYRSGCACGAKAYARVGDSCEMVYSHYDSDIGAMVMKCTVCGVYRAEKRTSTVRPGTCKKDTALQMIYTLEDQVIVTVKETFVEDSHLWVYTYTNTPSSCEEGYGYTASCVRCGVTDGTGDGLYDHNGYPVSITDLSAYGMSGYLVQYACACGQNKSWSFMESECNWSSIDHQNDVSTYYCEHCDTYSYRSETYQQDPTSCRASTTVVIEFVRNDQTVFTTTMYGTTEAHDEQLVVEELMNPQGSCLDGIRYVYSCKNCDHSYENTAHHHNIRNEQILETSCGTKIWKDSCLCGERRDVSRWDNCNYDGEHKETGDSNNGSYSFSFTCKDCGLRWTSEESWTRDSSTCMAVCTGSARVEYGTFDETIPISTEEERHDWGDSVYSLYPGSDSCYDGLKYTQTCRDCGNVSEGSHSGSHLMNVISEIDLADKGAVCGATLQYLRCPCGEDSKYDITKDSKCVLQKQSTDLWIEDALVGIWQNGVSGGQYYFNSEAYTFTCAVTEPACGLKLRMAEYWLVNDKCIATEYQIWQYWDSAENTWKDIVSQPTGLVRAFHNYEQTVTNTTQDDGTMVRTDLKTCACGSSYTDEQTTYADQTKKVKYTAINTTSAEEYKQSVHELHYGYVINGYAQLTDDRWDYLEHDGTTSWYHRTYAYQAGDDCGRTETYSDSTGHSYTNFLAHMSDIPSDTWVRESSCSQPGIRQWSYSCAGCGKISSSGEYYPQPTNHSWSQRPDGIYECQTCHQESTNGASAGIVLEDLTAAYGGDTSYVIGYWNQEEAGFVVSVSVEVEGAEQAVYLEGVDIAYETDIVAVSFDKAYVLEQAANVANGASYTLKVNFVTNGEDRVEYSLTLDQE